MRTELQRKADSLDCDLYSVIEGLHALADRIRVAAPELRKVAMELSGARSGLRRFMHKDDRERTA